MYNFDRKQQTITIEGVNYSAKDFEMIQVFNNPFWNDLYSFLHDWFSDNPTLNVQTSGSTGIPKEIQVEKERMMQSARLTCSFLGLKAGDKALLGSKIYRGKDGSRPISYCRSGFIYNNT